MSTHEKIFYRYTVGDKKDDPSLFCRSGDLVTHSSHLPYGLQKRKDPITQNLSTPKRVSFSFLFLFLCLIVHTPLYTYASFRLLSSPFYCVSYKIFWISFFSFLRVKKELLNKTNEIRDICTCSSERTTDPLYIENSHQYLHHYTHIAQTTTKNVHTRRV